MNRFVRRVSGLSLAVSMTIAISTLSSSARDAHAADPAAPASSSRDDLFGGITGVDGGLTSDDVAARARRSSPDLAAKRAEVERAARELDRTLVDLFPRLSMGAKYTRLSSTGSSELGPLVVAPGVTQGPVPAGSTLAVTSIPMESIDDQFSFTASLTVPLSDYAVRLPQTRRAAHAAARAAELDLAATARDVELDARVLYYNWVKAELAAAVAKRSLRLAETQRDRIARLFDAGASTAADEAAARALVAKSKLLVDRSEHLATQLRDELSILMHDEAGALDYRVGEEVEEAAPTAPPSRTTLTNQALGARPELAAAKARVASLVSQADATRSLLYPRLDAAGSIGAVNPDQRRFPQTAEFHKTWQVGVTLSFSPNDAASGAVAGSAADARTRAAMAQASAIEDAIRTEIVEARTALLDARAAIESTARELEAAELAYDARSELFIHGRATPVEVEQAHDDLLRARLDVIDAHVALRIAGARIAHAAGPRTKAGR